MYYSYPKMVQGAFYMNKPKIVHKKVVLNDKNIDDFLVGQTAAQYYTGTKTIIVRDYKIGPTVPADKVAKASEIIKLLEDNKEGFLVHEKHHWHNNITCGDVTDNTGINYFQEIALYCLDEISAFAATALYTDPDAKKRGINAYSVAYAISAGVQEFADGHGLDIYLSKITDGVRSGVELDLQYKTIGIDYLGRLSQEYRLNRKNLFNERFYEIANTYFTYDNYCIFQDKLSPQLEAAFTMVRVEIQDVVLAYCNALDKMLTQMRFEHRFRKK